MKLKPCLKCGSGELYQREQISDNVAFKSPIFVVECATCRCIVYGYTVEKAIEAWNHRPIEDALKSHAVEVLAKEVSRKALAQDGIYVIGFKEYWEKHPEWRETCRAEARALLGWEE